MTKEFNNISILIVDDDKGIRDVIRKFFDDFSYEIDFAEDGKIALEKIEATKYDIFLLDIVLPHINGLELVKHIKSKNPYAKILFMTGNASNKEIKKIYDEELGITIIKKPFKVNTLDKCIEMARELTLQERRKRLQLKSQKINNDKKSFFKKIILKIVLNIGSFQDSSEIYFKIALVIFSLIALFFIFMFY